MKRIGGAAFSTSGFGPSGGLGQPSDVLFISASTLFYFDFSGSAMKICVSCDLMPLLVTDGVGKCGGAEERLCF